MRCTSGRLGQSITPTRALRVAVVCFDCPNRCSRGLILTAELPVLRSATSGVNLRVRTRVSDQPTGTVSRDHRDQDHTVLLSRPGPLLARHRDVDSHKFTTATMNFIALFNERAVCSLSYSSWVRAPPREPWILRRASESLREPHVAATAQEESGMPGAKPRRLPAQNHTDAA